MRIAVFIKRTTFHKSYGGLETQNKSLCEELARRGHEVYVFSPQLDYSGKKILRDNGISYVFVKSSYRSLGGFAHLDKNNWQNRSFEDFMFIHKQTPFDIILGQSSAALGLIKRKNEFDVPIVSISHGTTIGEYRTRLLSLDGFNDWLKLIPDTAYVLFNFFKRQREFILHSNRVIAVSKAVKNALVDETFVPEEKVKVIYNGINSSKVRYEEARENKDRIRFLYLGLVHKSKGLGDLVKAIKNISKATLTVIGDGPYLQDLEEFITKNNLQDRVDLKGKVKHDDVLEMLTNFDIFVLPSRRVEGFPMTLVEAMFAGLPIIGSDMGGIPEAIEEGSTGFVIESGNIKQLEEKMNYLINNEEDRKNMSIKSRKKAESEFTIENMVDRYEKVIKGVIK